MTKKKGKLDRLETGILRDLAPNQRVAEVLTAAAAGNASLAARIAHAVPIHTYRAPDVAYTDRLEAVEACCKALVATIDRYRFAQVQVDALAAVLSPGGYLTEGAPDTRETVDLIFSAWRKGLRAAARGDWLTVDTVCREDLGLAGGAWTLLQAFDPPLHVMAWMQDVLSEVAPGPADGDRPEAAPNRELLAALRAGMNGAGCST